MLGDIALFSGQVAAAQTAYDRALRALIDDPRLQGPADALAAGRPDAAERDLRIVLARDPNALAAGQLLAEALARQGRLADAEGLLAQCVERARRTSTWSGSPWRRCCCAAASRRRRWSSLMAWPLTTAAA